MNTAPLTYLSMDSLATGVGASQVLPYVEELSRRGLDVTLISFEQSAPSETPRDRLESAGIRWRALPFGRHGAVGGAGRVARAARAVRGAELLHARSDMAAAAALAARVRPWVWDVRSFWADQRIELGVLRRGSPEERMLRLVERRSAATAAGIVVLARAAIPELQRRHGSVATRTAVVPTCVDLNQFARSDMPATDRLRLLLSGTLNLYYDVPLMARLVDAVGRHRPAVLEVVSPAATPWDDLFERVGATRSSAVPAAMPEVVAGAHVGLAVCRLDAGVSLAAAMPTKLGEFLAAGRPVAVNGGLGDMDELLADGSCGVVLRDGGDAELRHAASRLVDLVDDPETPARCRALAERHFDLDRGVDALIALYEHVSDRG